MDIYLPDVPRQKWHRFSKSLHSADAVDASNFKSDSVVENDMASMNSGISLFRNVDMSVRSGQVCVILGGSGSGKTTLLNAIAGRMNDAEVSISGGMMFNGKEAKPYWNNGSVGYLQQNDFLMPHLTVRETLNYAASLRLPKGLSNKDKQTMVELVLLELGLKDCANTRVGDAGGGETGSSKIRGISGGERRRVSAGVQLLTDPKMLLCDEVTSGLDAFSSFEVMKSLTQLARSAKKTIIISIHQPRSEIFKLLSESDGQMVLLSKGDVVYSGPVRSAMHWIESTGVDACPTGVNPFDYLLDLSLIDYSSKATELMTAATRETLIQAWAKQQVSSDYVGFDTDTAAQSTCCSDKSYTHTASARQVVPPTTSVVSIRSGPGLWSQILTLTSRGWKNQFRDSLLFWGCMSECVIVGLALGVIYYHPDGSLAGIRSRTSLIEAVSCMQPYLMLMITIYRFSNEIVVYDRERMDRWYGPIAYLVSTCFYSAIPNMIYPTVFSAITYYLVGLRTDSVEHFGIWILTNTASQFVAFSFAILCTSLVRGYAAASLLGNTVFMIFDLSAGFFIVNSSIPAWLRWIKYLSFPRIGFHVLNSSELSDRLFSCPFTKIDGSWDTLSCAAWDGNLILKNQLHIEPHYYPGPIAYLILYFIGFLSLAYMALKFNVVNPTRASASMTLTDVLVIQVAEVLSGIWYIIMNPYLSCTASPGASIQFEKASILETRLEVFSKGLDQKDPITIRVEGLCLSVSLSSFEWSLSGILRGLKRERVEKQLLKDVDVVFPAGELTAILGGSGAGKTSLLNALLHRHSTEVKATGSIYFNDTRNPSLQTINGVSSYVRQDDKILLSHLTVRETLRYAADLQMSYSTSEMDRYAKVEDVIDLLGLRECADVIIGNDAIKGCSGGQRRRVSIGMQLFTEPACLFLDEPTTGLDALTAKSIVLTLKRIAMSGRTVVCTIHQPRADIWHVFDNVVLLVTGGCAAYSGRASEVESYFAAAGHVAPAFTNIPDFILDTASVNLRSAAAEEMTRRTVDALVNRFNANKDIVLGLNVHNTPPAELIKTNPQFVPFRKAFPILARRLFVNTFRQKGLYFNRIAQPFMMTVILTVLFAPLGNEPIDTTNRLGLLQYMAPFVFSGMLSNVAIYPSERDMAYREISDGGYSVTSFYFSFLVNEVPLGVIGSLGCTILFLVVMKLRVTAMTFFSFWVIVFGYINVGESIGMLFSTIVTHPGFNITLMSALISIFAFMTGIVAPNMPQWLDTINYISPFKYGSMLVTWNEFEGRVFDCSSDDVTSGACPFPTGKAVLQTLNYLNKDWNLYMGLFMILVFTYRVLAWLALVVKAKHNRW